MNNKHTYAKITKDLDHNYYNVVITRTGSGIFGGKEDVQEIPFVFKTAEIAKDFVSMLPDTIEKVSVNSYRCNYCHLCRASYETYKLSIGEYEVFIEWCSTKRNRGGFLSDRISIEPINNVVNAFVSNLKPEDFNGYDIKYDYEYKKLTELIQQLRKDKNDFESQKEEYNFELLQQ